VLIENISSLLPDANLLTYPWNRAIPVDFRVKVDVKSFEQQPDGRVLLAAAWDLSDGEGKIHRREESRIKTDVSGEGYQAVVLAMNGALAELSEDLAKAVSGSAPAQ
jgi:hypothetical protein